MASRQSSRLLAKAQPVLSVWYIVRQFNENAGPWRHYNYGRTAAT
ncbi:hypothetical protein [Sphingomonas sp. PP-F2F-A104-K0414]|nr:hypothetical protein [Sphingomonas sp. PP-F2F-A104-K0414]